jgi:hypothetical protein
MARNVVVDTAIFGMAAGFVGNNDLNAEYLWIVPGKLM